MEKPRVMQEPVDEDLSRYEAAHAALLYYGNRIEAVRAAQNSAPVQQNTPAHPKRQQVIMNHQEKTFDPNIPHENLVRDRAPPRWDNTSQQQPYYPDLSRCYSSPGAEPFSYPSQHFLSPEMYHAYYGQYLHKQQVDAQMIKMRRLDVSPVRCLPKVQKPIPAYHEYMMTQPLLPPVFGRNPVPPSLGRYAPDAYQMEIPKFTNYKEHEEKNQRNIKLGRFRDDDEYYSGSTYGRSDYASSNPSSIIDEDTFRDIISEDQIVRESQCDETEHLSIPEDSLEHAVEHFEQKLSHSIVSGNVSPNIPLDILKQMRPKASGSLSGKLCKKLEQLMGHHQYSQTDAILESTLTHLPSIDKYMSTDRTLGVDVEIQTGKEGKDSVGVGRVKDGIKTEGACSEWADIFHAVSNPKGGIGVVKGGTGSVKGVGGVKSEVNDLNKRIGLGEQRNDGMKRGITFVKGGTNISEKVVASVKGGVGSENSEVGSVVVEEGSSAEGRGSLSSVTVVLSAAKFSNETVIVKKEQDKNLKEKHMNTDWTGIGLDSDEIEICTINTNYLEPCQSFTHLFQARDHNEGTLPYRQYSDEDNFMSYPGHENDNESVEINTASPCEGLAETNKLNFHKLSAKLSEFAYKFCRHREVQSNVLIQRELDRYKRSPPNTRETQSVQRMVRLTHTLRVDPIIMLMNFLNVMFSGRFSVLAIMF